MSLSYNDVPLLERPRAAAAAGFEAIEIWWPFSCPDPPRDDIAALASAIRSAGVKLALLNLYGGNLGAGDRGILSHPRSTEHFYANLSAAIRLAEQTGCRTLNALYGNRNMDKTEGASDELALRHLAAAARAAADIGAFVVVESLNSVECPTYPLVTPDAVAALVQRVRGASGAEIGYLCDVYHLACMGLDPASIIRKFGEMIRHIQVADFPGRGIPGSGSIRFAEVTAALKAAEFTGFIGVECRGSEQLSRQALVGLMSLA
ncbi:TIM barrel protein [Micromonospora craniellae]|nr:TIM barrel protein [Micromonospora craniellae]